MASSPTSSVADRCSSSRSRSSSSDRSSRASRRRCTNSPRSVPSRVSVPVASWPCRSRSWATCSLLGSERSTRAISSPSSASRASSARSSADCLLAPPSFSVSPAGVGSSSSTFRSESSRSSWCSDSCTCPGGASTAAFESTGGAPRRSSLPSLRCCSSPSRDASGAGVLPARWPATSSAHSASRRSSWSRR